MLSQSLCRHEHTVLCNSRLTCYTCEVHSATILSDCAATGMVYERTEQYHVHIIIAICIASAASFFSLLSTCSNNNAHGVCAQVHLVHTGSVHLVHTGSVHLVHTGSVHMASMIWLLIFPPLTLLMLRQKAIVQGLGYYIQEMRDR